VIGEGANLGTTSAVASKGAEGIKLNTDAIDNSAGVNTSDVEVNLKIALARPERDVASAERPQQPACRDDRRSRHVGGTQQLSADAGAFAGERKGLAETGSSLA